MEPHMHQVEKNIFFTRSCHPRNLLTKVMNNLLKDLKILIFKVIFQC